MEVEKVTNAEVTQILGRTGTYSFITKFFLILQVLALKN